MTIIEICLPLVGALRYLPQNLPGRRRVMTFHRGQQSDLQMCRFLQGYLDNSNICQLYLTFFDVCIIMLNQMLQKSAVNTIYPHLNMKKGNLNGGIWYITNNTHLHSIIPIIKPAIFRALFIYSLLLFIYFFCLINKGCEKKQGKNQSPSLLENVMHVGSPETGILRY